MARPIEFERSQALDAAMRVFWAHGYAGASLDMLLEAMELSKSSFYQAFGSKRKLLVEAIDLYTSLEIEQLSRLWRSKSFRVAMKHLLKTVVVDNNGGHGCLLVNCAAEIAPHDKAAATSVRRGFERMIGAFEVRIRRAQRDGEISTRRNARELARLLATSIAGLRVVAKAGLPRPILAKTCDEILISLTA